MYIATTYIGSAYIPGDTISEDIPAEKLEWLIQAGAVRESAPAPSPAPEPIPAEADIEQPNEAEPDEIDEEEVAPEIDAMAGIVKGANEAPAKKPRPAAKRAPKGGKTK